MVRRTEPGAQPALRLDANRRLRPRGGAGVAPCAAGGRLSRAQRRTSKALAGPCAASAGGRLLHRQGHQANGRPPRAGRVSPGFRVAFRVDVNGTVRVCLSVPALRPWRAPPSPSLSRQVVAESLPLDITISFQTFYLR